MNQHEKNRQSLILHYCKYPLLQIHDIFKYIYQSSFGCEHMVSSPKASADYILKEYDSLSSKDGPLVDSLDGEYSRVHLAYLKQGLSAETFGKLFYASAKTESEGKTSLENRLRAAKELANEGKLPFSAAELDKAVLKWQADGYPPVHHSDAFRKEYKPAYRVISDKYVTFLPFFARLDKMLKNCNITVAVEGGSASGKTTLARMLEELYDCTVFHTDDFFLRPEQRTSERYAETGGNIDRERFLEEVLIPLEEGKNVNYRKFDCSTMTVAPPITVKPKKMVIIEGAYSMHPEFEKYYDFSVFLDVSQELQKARIAKRNSPQVADRFYNEWIPMENIYFSETRIKDRCDMSIAIL